MWTTTTTTQTMMAAAWTEMSVDDQDAVTLFLVQLMLVAAHALAAWEHERREEEDTSGDVGETTTPRTRRRPMSAPVRLALVVSGVVGVVASVTVLVRHVTKARERESVRGGVFFSRRIERK